MGASLISEMIVRADNDGRGDECKETDLKQAGAESVIFDPAGMRRDATSGNEKIELAGARLPVLAR